LFDTLDWLEARLGKNSYLLGGTITEADWRLFPTLFRFDAIYYSLFKCNLGHIYEQPTLWSYTRGLYQMPGIAATCDIDQCKLHYFGSLRMVNPSGIVPKGPKLDFGVHEGDIRPYRRPISIPLEIANRAIGQMSVSASLLVTSAIGLDG
jgi:putative glutathione S-transferase